MKASISFEDFQKVDIRIGTIIDVQDFPKAKIPAYQVKIDFGAIEIKKTSAQITKLYTKNLLLNKQVLAIVNFKPKQIANFMSECLILGIQNAKDVVLLQAHNIAKRYKNIMTLSPFY
ncbi:MAG: tRNA-binding protein [Flavobacteriaceae bacterium]|nr:tRNA-binding protein [Flavobacteriaceae bacterium]